MQMLHTKLRCQYLQLARKTSDYLMFNAILNKRSCTAAVTHKECPLINKKATCSWRAQEAQVLLDVPTSFSF